MCRSKIQKIMVLGILVVSGSAYAGLVNTVNYIASENIEQMAHTYFTPSNNYTYRFVNGSQDIGDGSDFEAVRNAFRSWVDIPSANLNIKEVVGAGNFRPGQYNAQNEISWIDSGYGYEDPWTDLLGLSERALAVVLTWIDPSNGSVLERDMYFNDVHYDWRTDSDGLQVGGFSIEHVALHEIGHIFGLRDIYNPLHDGWESWMGDDNELMTMYGYSSWNNDDVSLTAEDIKAISLLHPISVLAIPEPSLGILFFMAGTIITAVRKP
jgi:hypothetical protein